MREPQLSLLRCDEERDRDRVPVHAMPWLLLGLEKGFTLGPRCRRLRQLPG